MTDAQQALAQVREALAQKINNPMDGHEAYAAMQGFWRVCTPANIAAILAHVEAQAAENERLTKACRRAVIALAAATDQMPVFAADYAAVSDALKEQRCKF